MESCFGMQKVIDHKTDQNGRVFYKVQWEPTWEPAESLNTCQTLIDEFWSSVNKAGKPLKRKHTSNTSRSEENMFQAAESNFKADVENVENIKKLITAPFETSLASVKSESKVAHDQVDCDMSAIGRGLSPGASSTKALHYIENFDNPYVRLVVVCKICSKEQSLKFSGNWKQHFMTHVSDDEKPHKCSVCGKCFIHNYLLVKHLKTHSGFTLKAEQQF